MNIDETIRKEKPFWMVWNPNWMTPTAKHETEQSAQIEAMRVAKETGEPVHVLKCVGTAMQVTPPVIYTEIE